MIGNRRALEYFDWALLLATLIVPILGLVVLYSDGYNPDVKPIMPVMPEWMKSAACFKQALFMLLGVSVLLLSMTIPPMLVSRLSYPLYAIGVLLLIAVDIFGAVSNGSQRWLRLGSVNLQPSEFMKLGVILVLARYLSRSPPTPGGYRLFQLIFPFFLFLLPMGLIIKQPDLGTSLAVGATGFFMVLFLGIHYRTLLVMLLIAVAVIPLGWTRLHGYQQNRIINLFNPDFDPKGSGYHVNQSKIAVGSGDVFGKGFLKGTQTQLEFLPEHTTDFIFSVLAEEWGFVGCLVVLLAYFHFLFHLLRVASRSKELFQTLVVFGIASLIFFHTIVNVGMVVGLLPVVGIPLPLFSYGGSALVSNMFAVGLVMGISVRRGMYS